VIHTQRTKSWRRAMRLADGSVGKENDYTRRNRDATKLDESVFTDSSFEP
jgi:hypothetical protein